jgi:hypothetical protein
MAVDFGDVAAKFVKITVRQLRRRHRNSAASVKCG